MAGPALIDQSTGAVQVAPSAPFPLATLLLGTLAGLAIAWSLRRGWLRAGEGVRPPTTMLGILLGAFLLVLILGQIGLAFGQMLAGDAIGLRGMAIRLTAMYLAQLPAAIGIVLVLPRPPADDGLGPTGRAFVGAAALLLATPVIAFVTDAGTRIESAMRGAAPPPVAHETLRRLAESPGDPWAIAVMVCVVVGAPIIEEFAYRGALHGALRGIGLRGWPTILAVSLLFALMHVPAIPEGGMVGAMGGLFTLSVALGLVRERTRSLLPCVVMHAAFNGANLLLARFAAA
jgi:membrane protease YdiL (CAAX protease family)